MTCVIWNLTSICLERLLGSVQDRCMVCANAPQAKKPLWTHPMVLIGQEAQVEARFGLFGDRANLNPRSDARFAWNVQYA